jgi:integrase/recombinase XerD
MAERGRVFQTDAALIAQWLHGRPATTRRAYSKDLGRFLIRTGKPLAECDLADVQAFVDHLATLGLAPASVGRGLAAVKSVYKFGMRVGALDRNPADPVRGPATKDSLAERILPESDIQRMLILETDPLHSALLRLLYAGGLRVSEAVGLSWCDLVPRESGGQVTVFGKGSKTRVVLLPASVWRVLLELRGTAAPTDPVFIGPRGGRLTDRQARRIVLAAARRAGLPQNVSPHWFRHAHASHSLDRGAPISLVQATLGHASVATTGRYLHARPSESSGSYLGI